MNFKLSSKILSMPYLALLLAVSACGGGGGSSTPSSGISATAGDKYIGTWFGACSNSGATSSLGVSVITKAGDNLYNLTNSTNQYSGAGCAGTATSTGATSSSFQITGVTGASGLTVDTVSSPDGTSRDLLYLVTPTTFRAGDPASGIDINGYPTSLSAAIATKQ